jgi:hypothetical protein
LKTYTLTIMEAVERSEHAVYERFERISDILVNGAEEEGKHNLPDEPSLKDYALAIAERRREREALVIPEVKVAWEERP